MNVNDIEQEIWEDIHFERILKELTSLATRIATLIDELKHEEK